MSAQDRGNMSLDAASPNPHWNSTNIETLRADNSSDQLANATSILKDCLILQLKEFIPWNNPDSIVSGEVEELTRVVKEVILLPILFLFGGPANLINMVVFYKQGLKERINVCLFALSLADELYLINNMLCYGEQLVVQFTTKEKYGPFFQFLTNNNLVGLTAFTWVSQIFSAIIAVDRCYCILHPLRYQNILSASTMTIIIVVICVVTVGLFSFSVARYRIACVYDPFNGNDINMFVPGDFYIKHQALLDFLDYIVFGTCLPGLVMITVIIATILTTVKLREAATWRAGTSSGGRVSQRDIALTKMLVSNSIFFIGCVLPFTLTKLLFLFMPEMNAGRRQHNFYVMFHAIFLMGSYVNATFNIVVYYTMGSRYRQTFWQLFSCGVKKASKKKETGKEIVKSTN